MSTSPPSLTRYRNLARRMLARSQVPPVSSSVPKFCRCILKVAEKNSNMCNKKKRWSEDECYNPYSVCAGATGTSTGRRPCKFKFNDPSISAKQLKSYGYLNFKSYDEWANRKSRTKLYKLRARKKIRQHLKDWYRSKMKPRV